LDGPHWQVLAPQLLDEGMPRGLLLDEDPVGLPLVVRVDGIIDQRAEARPPLAPLDEHAVNLGVELCGLPVRPANHVGVLEQPPCRAHRVAVLLALLERRVVRLEHGQELRQRSLVLAIFGVPLGILPLAPPLALENDAAHPLGLLVVLSVPGAARGRSLLTLGGLLVEPRRTQQAVRLLPGVSEDRLTNRALTLVAVRDAAAGSVVLQRQIEVHPALALHREHVAKDVPVMGALPAVHPPGLVRVVDAG